MQTTGKKLGQCKSRRSSFLLKEMQQSKLDSSSQKKNRRRIKRCKLKPMSRVKTKGSRKSIVGGKQGGRRPLESSDCVSSKYPSSAKLLREKGSILGNRGNGESSDHGAGIKKRRGRKRKRRKENVVQDEASRLQKRTRYLLLKMKKEQNLIDAYSGEGWKGQSREKIKPEKELERAEKQILKCKLGIRDAIQQLDILSSEGRIADSMMFPDGSVFHEHIFCAICKSCEAFQDNDIILCDGACNCGFHQKCLDPPLTKIPPGDQGWLCKFCDCKLEILDVVNAHLGTCFTVNSNWEDIFKEAALDPHHKNNYLDPDHELSSEDSEDDDYDPERSDEGYSRASTNSCLSDKTSTSCSFACSSDQASSQSGRSLNYDKSGESSDVVSKRKDQRNLLNSIPSMDFDDAEELETMNYQRQRRDVDYKKLHDEMFGKELHENEQQSEDEDWGPYRRKRKWIKSDDGNALASSSDKDADLKLVSAKGEENQQSLLQCRKTLFRIPRSAVEKLRQVFAENELPSRTVKENLSKQLGIAHEKVSKWFKNARYAALRIRKVESTEFLSNNMTQKLHSNARKKISLKGNALSSSSTIHVPKETVFLQKNSNPINTPLKMQKQRKAYRLPSDTVEANIKLRGGGNSSENKSLESKERTYFHLGEKKSNEHLYCVGMERLCNLEDRVEKLKKSLKACGDQCKPSGETYSSQPHVIYVPVVEMKEKV